MERFTGLLGIMVLLGLALSLSTRARAIRWRLVVVGLALQVILGWIFLAFPPTVTAVDAVAGFVTKAISFASEGSRFVFGDLADASGAWGFIFAVQALPVIIFFGSVMAVGYHLGIMQRVIAGFAWCLRRTLGITGAEALTVAANVFVGQTEAPLCVKPFLSRMTRSQLMLLMTGGFATIAGSVLGVYVIMLGGDEEAGRIAFAKHLLVASVLSAPAAVVMAKIVVPETEAAPAEDPTSVGAVTHTRNVLDAAAVGATDGMRLAVNVAAMLIAFVALVALANWPLQALSDWAPIAAWRAQNGVDPFSIQTILGVLFMPLSWTMGVPWHDCHAFGTLLGEKIVVTEFIAYASLGDLVNGAEGGIDRRTAFIATYALCGFANFPSIAIQIGGISALAPDRRSDLAALALRAMTAGACASWCTACVAGMFVGA